MAGEPVHHGALTLVLAKRWSGGTAWPFQLQLGGKKTRRVSAS